MNARSPMAAVLVALAVTTLPAGAQSLKPEAWKPKTPSPGVTAPATEAGYDTLRMTATPVTLPPGTTRPIDLWFQPSVPDSILPLMPLYVATKTDEQLTAYEGTLRQGSPERLYPVLMKNQPLHASVDGATGQTHLAIMVMVPWFGEILPLPYTFATLSVKIDGGPEQKTKLFLSPGPNLYMTGQRPVPLSNPTLSLIPLAPGAHKVEVRIKDLNASYVFVQLAQPMLSPLPVVKGETH